MGRLTTDILSPAPIVSTCPVVTWHPAIPRAAPTALQLLSDKLGMESHRGRDGEHAAHHCFMCGRVAEHVCPCCNSVWFCCSTHGRLHYREDVGSCFPWTVEQREGVGRLMVTTRKVLAGETLFLEEPIVHGPNQVGSPICLTCYSSITLEYKCAVCGYPMCDKECAQDRAHSEECVVLARGDKPVFENGETEAYHCILPLRMVLLARSDPDRFNLADHLMDHEEERRGGEDWVTTERTVVHNLLDKCKGKTIEKITETEMRRAIGVLEVNCYEVHSFINRNAAHNCGFRASFPAASLLSHGCVANSRHIWGISPPYTNTCIATVDIDIGQEVITSYLHPTTCTLRRRSKLKAGWYFECSCERCCSLTELNTNHNTLVCPLCKKTSLLPEDPKQFEGVWKCPCGYAVPELEIKAILNKMFAEIHKLIKTDRYNTELWLALLDSALSVVHPQHEVVIEIAKFLVPVLCRAPNRRTSGFPIELVRRKLELAGWYLNVTNVVDPGYSKQRVKVLYEVVETKLFLTFHETHHIEFIEDILKDSQKDLLIIVTVFEKLGPDIGFETLIVKASKSLAIQCSAILEQIKQAEFQAEDWKDARWSLLELCQ